MDADEFLSMGNGMSDFALAMWEYKTALLNAGFDDTEAFEMTKLYQTTFVSITLQAVANNKVSKDE